MAQDLLMERICDGHLLLSGGSLGLRQSVVCRNRQVAGLPDTFSLDHLTFIPLDGEGRPITSPSIELEVYSLEGANAAGSAPLFTSGPLLNQGALTVRVGMPPSPRPLLSPNDTYVLRVIGADLSKGPQEQVSSILYLSQRLNVAYESNLLSLMMLEMGSLKRSSKWVTNRLKGSSEGMFFSL